MELGWAAAIQAVVIAISTVIIRAGSRKDAATVSRSTAAQSTSNDILARVQAIETDLALVKMATLKDTEVDHRAPTRPKG